MAKIPYSRADLEQQLKLQLELLQQLTSSFDSGNELMALPIATCIRVLLHDTDASLSLLRRLGLKGKFHSTSKSKASSTNAGPYIGLVGVPFGPKKIEGYIPCLDDSTFGLVEFDNYWGEVIIIDKNGNIFCRKDIVLKIANEDGGAHIDKIGLEKKYQELTRQNSIGWTITEKSTSLSMPILGLEKASIRQIAHEILKTLVPDYPEQKMKAEGVTMLMSGTFFGGKKWGMGNGEHDVSVN